MLAPRIFFFSRVVLGKGGKETEYQVVSYRRFKDFFVVQLRGLNSITAAQSLVGHEVLVPEEALLPPEKDCIYFYQIEGFSVETIHREYVGVVKDALAVADRDLLVIVQGDKEHLIPFVHSICLQIEWEKRKIIIDPPEGLLDLNEI